MTSCRTLSAIPQDEFVKVSVIDDTYFRLEFAFDIRNKQVTNIMIDAFLDVILKDEHHTGVLIANDDTFKLAIEDGIKPTGMKPAIKKLMKATSCTLSYHPNFEYCYWEFMDKLDEDVAAMVAVLYNGVGSNELRTSVRPGWPRTYYYNVHPGSGSLRF